jgi:undecaprenyl-diphosphatase
MQYLRENKTLIFLALIILPAFHFDRTIISWVRDYSIFYSVAWNFKPIYRLINFVAHGATLITFSLALYLGAKAYSRRLSDAGRSLFIGLISAGLLVQVFKHLIGRARPRVTFDTVLIGPTMHLDYDSFPSGHTTLSFCLAFILSQYYPRYRFFFYLFAVLTGLVRVIGLSHFPSDVLAGALLGTVVAKVLTARMSPLPAERSKQGEFL